MSFSLGLSSAACEIEGARLRVQEETMVHVLVRRKQRGTGWTCARLLQTSPTTPSPWVNRPRLVWLPAYALNLALRVLVSSTPALYIPYANFPVASFCFAACLRHQSHPASWPIRPTSAREQETCGMQLHMHAVAPLLRWELRSAI